MRAPRRGCRVEDIVDRSGSSPPQITELDAVHSKELESLKDSAG